MSEWQRNPVERDRPRGPPGRVPYQGYRQQDNFNRYRDRDPSRGPPMRQPYRNYKNYDNGNRYRNQDDNQNRPPPNHRPRRPSNEEEVAEVPEPDWSRFAESDDNHRRRPPVNRPSIVSAYLEQKERNNDEDRRHSFPTKRHLVPKCSDDETTPSTEEPSLTRISEERVRVAQKKQSSDKAIDDLIKHFFVTEKNCSCCGKKHHDKNRRE
uniref:Periphilin-1 n=1 Tax=Steinernema glaseri TaxID=37863 RepID=A0A1I7ZDE3_9BILA